MTVAKRKHYLRPLDLDTRVRVEFEVAKGKVQRFLVQLEIEVQGEWRPAIRYDCAHGYAHCDRLNLRREQQKQELPLDYAQALTFAQQDIRKNWQIYRERYLKGEYP